MTTMLVDDVRQERRIHQSIGTQVVRDSRFSIDDARAKVPELADHKSQL